MANTFSWQTPDGLKIYGVDFEHEAPKAVLSFIHGIGEHIHRYDHMVDYLRQQGYAVVGYDRRGHGRSEGKRGHTPRFDAFLDEIDQLIVETKQRYAGLPHFLYGHSMGGNLLLNYAIRRRPDCQGTLVSAPHIQLGFEPPKIKILMGKLMRNIYPAYSESNSLPEGGVSRNPAVIAAYENDPLVHDKVTAATAIGMFEAAEFLDGFSGEYPLPLLLMHGSGDVMTSAPASQAFALRVSGDVTFRLWDGLFHELHNEPEQEEVFADMVRWMDERL